MGTVRAVDDSSAMAGAVVASRWTQYAIVKKRGLEGHVLTATSRSNGAGGYVLCRLPRDIPVDLTVEGASHTEGRASIEIGDDYVVRRDFALGRTVATVGAIRGTVKTARGKTAVNAIVGIAGTESSTRTDDAGRDVQALPAATIFGHVPTVDLSGFDTRRRSGNGEFMNAADIKRYGFVRTSEALYRFSQLQAAYISEGDGIAPQLAFVQRSFMGGRCTPRYYVDGMLEPDVLYNPVYELDRTHAPKELRGIEVHTAYDAPVQFPPDPRDGCGVVLVWTK